jgi:ribosome biogenesis protein ERB1
VCCVAPHPGGQWLATGSADGTVKLWEVSTGRCSRTWHLGSSSSSSGKDPGDITTAGSKSSSSSSVSAVTSVAWCPSAGLQLLAAAVDKRVVLLPSGLGGEEVRAAAAKALEVPSSTSSSSSSSSELATWSPRADGGVELVTKHPVRQVTWHARGDYFASVAPTGGTQVRQRGGGGKGVLS